MYSTKKDNINAVKWAKKAADQGDAQSQYNVGIAYWNGDGVTQDKVEAVMWFKKAVEQGYAKAKCALGKAYLLGEGGVKKNYRVAVMYFVEANREYDFDIVDQFEFECALNLAEMWTECEENANNGDAYMQYLVGKNYYGKGIAKRSIMQKSTEIEYIIKAYEYLQKAVNANFERAKSEISKLMSDKRAMKILKKNGAIK